MKVKLTPMKYDFLGKSGKRYTGYEQVLLEKNGQPIALFHADLLWPEYSEITDRLYKGEAVEVEVDIKEK